MTEEEAWDLFAAAHGYDEEKVAPEKRSGASKKGKGTMTEELAFSALMIRLGQARMKHPKYASDKDGAFGVIAEEFFELKHAIDHESRDRQIDEALDVAATCMRFVMGEHLQ